MTSTRSWKIRWTRGRMIGAIAVAFVYGSRWKQRYFKSVGR